MSKKVEDIEDVAEGILSVELVYIGLNVLNDLKLGLSTRRSMR